MKIILYMVCCVIGISPLPVTAGCFELIREKNAEFEVFIQCTNTLSEPTYEITHHYFGPNFVGLFFFDLKRSGMVCNEYDFNTHKAGQCRTTSINSVSKMYEGQNRSVIMINLDESELSEIQNTYEHADIFKFPDAPEEVSIENCFVVVENGEQVYMGYRNNKEFMYLSHCLIQYERFIAKNYKLFWK